MRPGSIDAAVPECAADRHGTHHARYRLGCVCPFTKDAAYRYRKAIRTGHHVPRLRPSTGTRRRVQAMAVAGRTGNEIAHAVGCDRRHLRRLLTAEQVTVEMERAVRAVEWMAWEPAPPSLGATFARKNAAERGWWPIDAWHCVDTDPEPSTVDEITVMHAVAGYLRWDQLREQEQRLVVQELGGRGWSDVRIAEHLSTNHSRVARARNRLGVPAVPTIGRRTA